MSIFDQPIPPLVRMVCCLEITREMTCSCHTRCDVSWQRTRLPVQSLDMPVRPPTTQVSLIPPPQLAGCSLSSLLVPSRKSLLRARSNVVLNGVFSFVFTSQAAARPFEPVEPTHFVTTLRVFLYKSSLASSSDMMFSRSFVLAALALVFASQTIARPMPFPLQVSSRLSVYIFMLMSLAACYSPPFGILRDYSRLRETRHKLYA